MKQNEQNAINAVLAIGLIITMVATVVILVVLNQEPPQWKITDVEYTNSHSVVVGETLFISTNLNQNTQ